MLFVFGWQQSYFENCGPQVLVAVVQEMVSAQAAVIESYTR